VSTARPEVELLKIKDVKTTVLSVPFKRRIASSPWPNTRFAVLVRVVSDDGTEGIGEAFAVGVPTVVAGVIERGLKPMLLGEDPSAIERLWDKMYRATIVYGRKGLVTIAMSGVEVALWDLLGKSRRLPVYEMLGGLAQDNVRAYASLLRIKDRKKLIKDVRGYLDEGYTAVKLHEPDVESVKIVRDVVGDGMDLMLDVNCIWTPQTSIVMARKLEKYGALWLEEPVWPPDDLDGSAAVAQAVDIPIAGGENEYTRWGFKDVLEKRAFDILQPDAIKAGGLLECKKIAGMAEAWNIPVAPHCWCSPVGTAAIMHLIASTPNCILAEMPPELEADILKKPIAVRKGMVEVPKGPGLGIELDEKTVAKYTVKT
jgi:L-alanine-DL-glutamate epimerase-like enolase superfamily enzyme